MRLSRHHSAFALLFSISVLALLAVMSVSFFGMTRIDRRLGRQFVDLHRARIAAESGLDFALSRVLDLADGPYAPRDYPLEKYDAAGRLLPSGYLEQSAPVSVAYYVSAEDESGKLNLNDPNPEGRLQEILGLLIDNLTRPGVEMLSSVSFGAGRMIADAVFLDPEFGRAAAGGRFQGLAELDTALRQAGLSEADAAILRRHVTVHGWTHPHTLQTNAQVYGNDLQGAALDDMAGNKIARWLEFQTREFALEPRSPVNVNTASPALLAALIEPVEGLFLAEGPVDCQSSEHYGWWATGLGAPDPNKDIYGVVLRTRRFTAEEAWRLATAMYLRIHGDAAAAEFAAAGLAVADDLAPTEQTDADGDGRIDPNPFETWDEFREFLERGLRDPDDGGPMVAGHGMFVGDGFEQPIDDTPKVMAFTQFEDPHVEVPKSVIDALTGVRGTHANDDHGYASYHQLVPPGVPLPAPKLKKYLTNVITSWNMADARPWRNAYHSQARRDMLYANFNPNSLFNDWNPDRNRYLMVDKAQLLHSTTEFCFAPTGYFSFSSRGAVELAGEAGAPTVLAARSMSVVMQCFEIRHLTTQAQFLAGLRDVGGIAEYFSAAGVGRAPNSPMELFASSIGDARPALQAYPEPLFPGAEDRLAKADYDGVILPATLETDFIRHVDTGFEAHLNGNDEKPLCIDSRASAAEPFAYGRPNRMHDGALAAEDPGALYPDGVFCEMDRTLAFKLGNINSFNESRGMRGLVSFWMKPNFHTGVSTRIRKFMAGPSQRGRYAIQQMAPLYLFPNGNNNDVDGQLSAHITWGGGFGLNQYACKWRNYWMPSHAMAFGMAWQRPDDVRLVSQWEDEYTGETVTQVDIIPSRYTFFENSCYSRAVTRDYPLAKQCWFSARPADYFSTVEHHVWSHVTAVWEMHPEGLDGFMNLPQPHQAIQARFCLNGTPVNKGAPAGQWFVPGGMELGVRGGTITQSGYGSTSWVLPWGDGINFNEEWLRFGELPGALNMGAADSALISGSAGLAYNGKPSPYYADSTIDEIVATGDPLGGYPLEYQSKTRIACSAWFGGRYHIVQTDPENLGIPTIGMYTSPALRVSDQAGDGSLSLRSIAWTVYRPRFNCAYDTDDGWDDSLRDNVEGIVVNPDDRPDPAAAVMARDTNPEHDAWDLMSVDFSQPGEKDSDSEKAWHFAAAGGERLTYPGGAVLNAADRTLYRATDTIRVRASFHIAEYGKNGAEQHLWEAPALDDLTLTFTRLQPRILEFTMPRE